jgi:altronate hydrolase
MNTAVVISVHDNVATALEPLAAGEPVRAGGSIVTTVDPIPRGHKLALRAIRAGEVVIKYGSPIGTASCGIAAGAHVHTHNVASARGRGDIANSRQPAPGSTQTTPGTVQPIEPRLAEPAE